MPTLGYPLFWRNSRWLARHCVASLGRAFVGVLRPDPEQTEHQIVKGLMDWYEPELLTIHTPLSTAVDWASKPVRYADGRIDQVYLHEARVPFDGTPELWRLAGSEDLRFTTRVSFTVKYARLRAFRPDQDTERFRDIVADDLDKARLQATKQDIAIANFRPRLRDAIDFALGNDDIIALRTFARELHESDLRANAALLKGGA